MNINKSLIEVYVKNHEHYKNVINQIYLKVSSLESAADKIKYLEDQISETQIAILKREHENNQQDIIEDDSVLDEYIEIAKAVINYCKQLLKIYKEMDLEKELKALPTNKIKWLASPSILGYVFIELINKGFVEMPLRNGEINYSEFARQLLGAFEFQTTQNTMENACNPSKNKLSTTKRSKFKIPQLADLK